MTDKLDPVLLELVERAVGPSSAGGARQPRRDRAADVPVSVDVLIALDRTADDPLLRDLADLGLEVRSVIGDILTGSIALTDVPRLAETESILRIEAGTPMHPEEPGEPNVTDGENMTEGANGTEDRNDT